MEIQNQMIKKNFSIILITSTSLIRYTIYDDKKIMPLKPKIPF